MVVCLQFTLCVALIALVGYRLSLYGDMIGAALRGQDHRGDDGVRGDFVGTLFIAAVTSLPEAAVSIAAVRLGARDLAMGNLLGSSLFDMVILAIDDITYLPGPLLSEVSPVHAVSALSAMMMSGIAIVGLFCRPRRRVFLTVG